MRVAVYVRGDKPRDNTLAEAFHQGGLEVHVLDQSEVGQGFDAHIVVGVTAITLIRELQADGVPWFFADKAYNRDWPEWWRFSYRSHQPVDFLDREIRPLDRADAQGWLDRIEAWRAADPRGHVLIAGASPTYHLFCGLPDPTTYAQQLVNTIRGLTPRRIVYRPKPQWRYAQAVDGAEFSHSPVKVKGQRIRTDLEGAHVMVTHGSGACLEAMLAGVPTITLGGAIVRPISSTSLDDVEYPRIPTDEERLRILAALAYCQWSLAEIRTGQAWENMRREICA